MKFFLTSIAGQQRLVSGLDRVNVQTLLTHGFCMPFLVE